MFGSDELVRIVLKACAFNPKDRYENATEMLNDIYKLFASNNEEVDIVKCENWEERLQNIETRYNELIKLPGIERGNN